MFKNYFTIAFRQLRKQKMYSAIKIGGFALGIAACLLIALYIRDELSYDQTYPDANRIYRVLVEVNFDGKLQTGADWPAPLAEVLRKDFPEIENSGRIMPHELFDGAGSNEIRRADKQENQFENKFSYADQRLLDMLQVPMLYGNRQLALQAPNSMVISRRKAEKYFPGENPIGHRMILNDDLKKTYVITGVMENFPATSHIQYDFLLTMTAHEFWPGEQKDWNSSNYPTYVILKAGVDAAQFQPKLKHILTKYFAPAMQASGDNRADQVENIAKLILQPIKDIHLRSYNIDDGIEKGDIRFVWLFGAIASFILILACINFINLSTAKSANRAKEVGLRKVVGSLRGGLIRQFLTESMLFSFLSFMLGILIALIFLPYFNQLSGKSLTIPWNARWLAPMLAGSAAGIGILAGLYPSFYLSSFKPIEVLKGQASRGTRNSILRNGLVVFQFTTSIALIICTLIIYRQTHYLLNKKPGFEKDQVMLIEGTNTLGDKTNAFKDELLRMPQIKSVSVGDFLPISGLKRNQNTFYRHARAKEDLGVVAQKWDVDYDYLTTMGMRISSGRNFSRDMASDSMAVILNQAMADKIHLKSPLGEMITNGWQSFRVIGIVEDFNYETMKQHIEPLCMTLGGNRASIISVRMKGTEAKQLISSIGSNWKKFSPTQPIRYQFLDERFANMYLDVQRMGQIFTSFAVLAIIIACLGLFALSAFMAEQRNKEIGIRKVLGASISGITAMLSGYFIRLVVIAIVIAIPLSWWAMNQWLQSFAYRLPISVWIFVIAAVLSIVIALLTVSFQAIKAAAMNPTRSLRSE